MLIPKMADDTPNLESDLHKLNAAGLDPTLLDRLEAAADDRLTELSPLERQFEAELRRFRPTTLSPSLLASLEIQCSGIAFPKAAAVVPFPNLKQAPQSRRSVWGAAAAVALLGALAALFIPTKSGNNPSVAGQKAPSIHTEANPSALRSSDLTPADFSRKLSETSDEGVIWPSNQQAHRVLKVVYKDLVTLKRADGSSYQVEQPRVEYFIVPTHSD